MVVKVKKAEVEEEAVDAFQLIRAPTTSQVASMQAEALGRTPDKLEQSISAAFHVPKLFLKYPLI
jgi:hypothetical protein